MKKSKVLVLSLMFALIGSFTTYANSPISNPNEIRQEILDLVSDIDLSDMKADYERVYVQFLVNAKNEIVVLNVSDKDFESSIKAKLNYKKIESEETEKSQIYNIPVVFKKK